MPVFRVFLEGCPFGFGLGLGRVPDVVFFPGRPLGCWHVAWTRASVTARWWSSEGVGATGVTGVRSGGGAKALRASAISCSARR